MNNRDRGKGKPSNVHPKARSATRGRRQSASNASPVVPAVLKAVEVIRLLNDRGSTGASLPEIVAQLHITRSHCHNILRTLVYCRWLRYDSLARLYQLNSTLSADVASALVSTKYLGVIQPYVRELAEIAGFPCMLSEPIADGSFLVVQTANTADPFVFNVSIGFRYPAGSPPHMKAELAWLSREAQEKMLERWKPIRYTSATITDRDEMLREFALIRKRGYARSVGEFTEGFTTLVVPIFNRAGEVFLILQCAGVTQTMRPREAKVAEMLIACAAAIHRAIDGRPPADYPTGDPKRQWLVA
jgi:DNA-binding IclR family transcriptional regulator